MREIMDGGKILIANLSKGKIGEDNSKLLGALLVTKLQLAAMSRVDIPEEKRRDFFLYVDEFQNFATEAFANILSEARKYRLSLVLANQYIAQLEEMTPTGKSTKVRDAIFGNVGTIICFRVGAEDAEFLEKEFIPEFMAEDLINLGKYNIYIKLMIDGMTTRPFSAQTLPPREKPKVSFREKIIRVSRERYGTKREIVEQKIEKWAGTVAPTPPTVQPTQVNLFDAQCSKCGKWIKVPFQPDPSRPVYCKSCLKKIESEGEKTVSLREIKKIEPVPFSGTKKVEEKPKKRPRVNLAELKKVLERALGKNEKNN
jgi:CxxC-x17-CxxC domain-containing protein